MKGLKYLADNIEKLLCVALTSVMLLILSYQMVCRLASIQNVWTDELSRYLYIWLIYLGAGLAMYHTQHIRIDILHKVWPKKIRDFIGVIGVLMSLAFCSFILVGTAGYTLYVYQMRQVSGSLKIPMFLIYAAVNAGFLSLVIRQVQKELLPGVKALFAKRNGPPQIKKGKEGE